MDMQLWQLAGTDPYTEMQKGPFQRQQFELQREQLQVDKQKQELEKLQLQEQAQYLKSEQKDVQKQTEDLKQPLSQMASSLLPPDKFSLVDSSGQQTIASKANPYVTKFVQETQNLKKNEEAFKRATIFGDKATAARLAEENRRIIEARGNAENKINEFLQEGSDSIVYDASLAKSQVDYDNRIKASMDRAGIKNRPSWLPEKWTPEITDEILPRASQKMKETIQNRIDKIQQAKDRASDQNMQEIKYLAKLRTGTLGGKPSKGGEIDVSQMDLTNSKSLDTFINQINKRVPKSQIIDKGFAKTTLNQINPEYRSDLDTPKAITDVGNRIQVAREAYDISNFIIENKVKTGALGEFKKKIDSYSLKNPDAPINLDLIQGSVGNQVLAKKILDFANSYARSESGRNIATVAELKAAISTFGEKGMSGQSAATVFKYIGDQKIKQINDRQFGGKDAVKIQGMPEPKKELPKEEKPANMSESDWKEYQNYVASQKAK